MSIRAGFALERDAQHLRLRRIVRENHGGAVMHVVQHRAIIATASIAQANLYDSHHLGDNLDTMEHCILLRPQTISKTDNVIDNNDLSTSICFVPRTEIVATQYDNNDDNSDDNNDDNSDDNDNNDNDDDDWDIAVIARGDNTTISDIQIIDIALSSVVNVCRISNGLARNIVSYNAIPRSILFAITGNHPTLLIWDTTHRVDPTISSHAVECAACGLPQSSNQPRAPRFTLRIPLPSSNQPSSIATSLDGSLILVGLTNGSLCFFAVPITDINISKSVHPVTPTCVTEYLDLLPLLNSTNSDNVNVTHVEICHIDVKNDSNGMYRIVAVLETGVYVTVDVKLDKITNTLHLYEPFIVFSSQHTNNSPSRFTISPCGKFLLLGDASGGIVIVLLTDIDTCDDNHTKKHGNVMHRGDVVRRLHHPRCNKRIETVCYSSRFSTITCGSNDGLIWRWDYWPPQ